MISLVSLQYYYHWLVYRITC